MQSVIKWEQNNTVKTCQNDEASPLLSARADQVPTVEVAQGIAADVCAV
jgi:hypothetical protein